MKASLLARAAPALLLATILAGGAGTTGFAQTTPSTPAQAPGTSTTPSSGATTVAPGTTATTHQPSTAHYQHGAAGRVHGETMQQLAEQHIAGLHAKLHITAAQQPQFDQFAQVMRDNAKNDDQAYQQRAAKIQSMNAVENMQSYADIEQARAQEAEKLVPAFQTLYAVLSDQQKKQTDELFRHPSEGAHQRPTTAH